MSTTPWIGALVDLVDGQAAVRLHGGRGSSGRRGGGHDRRGRSARTAVGEAVDGGAARARRECDGHDESGGTAGGHRVRVSWDHVRWEYGVVAWNNRRLKGTSRAAQGQVRPACAVRHDPWPGPRHPGYAAWNALVRCDRAAPAAVPVGVARDRIRRRRPGLRARARSLVAGDERDADRDLLGDRRGQPRDPRPRRRERDRARRRIGPGGRGAPHRRVLLRPPRASAQRAVAGGELRLRSRCPATVLASCSASYQRPRPGQHPRHRHARARATCASAPTAARRASTRRPATSRSAATAGSCCRRGPRAATCWRARRARRSGSSCARARATSARSCRPGATASTPTPTAARRRVVGLTPAEDAPFQIQALSARGRRRRGDAVNAHAPRCVASLELPRRDRARARARSRTSR